MRHKVAGRRFDRPTDQRMALLHGLVTAVLWHGSIETTEAKAKEARSLLEKMITRAQTPDLHSRRMARRVINDERLVKRLFDVIAPIYKDRPGGYSRVTRLGFRRGDAAPLAKLELVDFPSK